MDVPIVQGVAVPSGQGGQPYGTTGGYGSGGYKVEEVQQQQYNQQNQQQGNGYKDVVWGVSFILHLVAMLGLIGYNLSAVQQQGAQQDDGSGSSGYLWLVGMSAIIGVGLASLSLGFMMKHSEALVKMALFFSVGMSLLVALMGFAMGNIIMGVLGIISFAVGICYAYVVWRRIPFAAANLNTACTAVRSNMGLTFIAYFLMAVAFGWTLIWFLGLGGTIVALSNADGDAGNNNAVFLFFLLLSYYWVHQVLQNTVHVTVAGTVGTWWFVPDEATSASCGINQAIRDSFCRATSYSFGSICLGSLLVAVVQALRTTQNLLRDNDDFNFLVCIIDCILGCIQGIIEYVNKWAYVYVGLYGFGYIEAGKNVIQLFENKGWTVIITDDLTENVLGMVNLSIGLLTGIATLLMAMADPNLLASLGGDDQSNLTLGFIIGLIAGYVFSSILMSIVASATNTVIVCYAESPNEFERNHPQLSSQMRHAWMQAWPDLNF